MKRYLFAITLLGATLGTALTSQAQTVVQTQTATTTAGTISEFGPETIVIRSETAPEPVRYSYTKSTTYVDETGAPVTIETVKSGLPVTVHYRRAGDQMVAERVIVRRAVTPSAPVIEKKTTTTTTTTTPRKEKD